MNPNRRFEKQKFAGFKPKLQAPKGWSHQSELESLKGKMVFLNTLAGSVEGVLEEADQFTVKIGSRSAEQPALVVFKSSIHLFYAL